MNGCVNDCMHKPCENRSVSFGDRDTDYYIIQRVNYIIRTGSSWLRIGTGGGHL
jgi:hypothetical protein